MRKMKSNKKRKDKNIFLKLDESLENIKKKRIKSEGPINARFGKVNIWDEEYYRNCKNEIIEFYQKNELYVEQLEMRKYYLQTKNTSYYSIIAPVILSIIASAISAVILSKEWEAIYFSPFKILNDIRPYLEQKEYITYSTFKAVLASGVLSIAMLMFILILALGLIFLFKFVLLKMGIFYLESGSYIGEFVKQYEIEYIEKMLDNNTIKNDYSEIFYISETECYLGCKGKKCEDTIQITEGETVYLDQRDSNPYNKNIIRVLNKQKKILGYVPNDCSQALARLIEEGRIGDCYIFSVVKGNGCDECIGVRVRIKRVPI